MSVQRIDNYGDAAYAGLSGKFDNPTGTTLEYLRGDGVPAALNRSEERRVG